MAVQQWWVQIHRGTAGPMPPTELRTLARHRIIDPETLVSSDKVRWVPAGHLKGLFESPPEESNSQTGANPAGSTSRGDDASDGREGRGESSAEDRDHPAADKVAPLLPVLRTRSRFLRTEVVAIYKSHLLKGTRYWRRLVLTEAMCHPAGEPELRQQLHRSRRVEFDEVREFREVTTTRRAGPFSSCRFEARSSVFRRTRFRLPVLESRHPRLALTSRLEDRYVIRRRRGWVGIFGFLLFLCGLFLSSLGISIMANAAHGAGAMGAVATTAGGLIGFLGFYHLIHREAWTQIAEYELPELKPAQRPRKPASSGREPIYSKSRGWTYKLLGLAYFAWLSSPLANGLWAVIFKYKVIQAIPFVWAPAPALIFRGYRLCQRRYEPAPGDDRKPVLFLRPFDDDMVTSLQPSGILGQLTGLREGWMSGFYGRVGALGAIGDEAAFNSHPIRLLRLLFDRATDSSEESLVRFFAPYGPVVAIGKPGESLATPGAARVYLPDDEWQQAVLAELRRARAVVLQPGSTTGVHWEFEQIRALDRPRQFLLCLVSFVRNPQRYEEMSQVVRAQLRLELPRVVPYLDRPTFVYFDGDWTPHLQELSYKSPLLWPVTSDAADLSYTLEPFVQGMLGRASMPPRTVRWTRGLRTSLAGLAAVVVSLALTAATGLIIGLITALLF